MTSPLPPRRRDTRSYLDRIRQDRVNLRQLAVGIGDGRFPPARLLGATEQLGDLEDDEAGDTGTPLEILQFVNDDSVTWSGDGDLAIGLSHIPWSDSLQVKLNGHELEPSEWTYDSSLNAVTIPAAPWWELAIAAGAEVRGTAYYAYYEGDDLAVEPGGGGTILAFESTGWKFKQVLRTDGTDYSAAAYDDSGWATAQAGFGDSVGTPDTGWPTWNTTWTMGTRMWGRRTLSGLVVGEDIQATIRVDRDIVIYLDGVQVHASSPNGVEVAATISGANVTSTSMVLACRVTDESSTLGCYFDLELTQ